MVKDLMEITKGVQGDNVDKSSCFPIKITLGTFSEQENDLLIFRQQARWAFKYPSLNSPNQLDLIKNYLFCSEESRVQIENDHFIREQVPWIFTCAHTRRDVRCGQCGPAIIDELQRLSQQSEWKGKFKIGSTSHIGGHKFAGNIIIYPTGDWYGLLNQNNIQEVIRMYFNGDITNLHWRGQMALTPEQQKLLKTTT
uniref:Uncharacterized protein n=1 Tax=Arcella intermedia TaxID=1963864 RepID=A0A6B2LGU5_9EUKA